MSGHTCHWPGCGVEVPPAMWGCKPHWFALPKRLRDRIWQTYRRGQEVRKNPSPEYIFAAQEVQLWIREYRASMGAKGLHHDKSPRAPEGRDKAQASASVDGLQRGDANEQD